MDKNFTENSGPKPEVQAAAAEKAAETPADKQKALKDGLQAAGKKEADLQAKIDNNPDKDFKDFLENKNPNMGAELQEITAAIAQIKAGPDVPNEKEKNAATLAEVEKVLAA
jgi:hypothetical protein